MKKELAIILTFVMMILSACGSTQQTIKEKSKASKKNQKAISKFTLKLGERKTLLVEETTQKFYELDQSQNYDSLPHITFIFGKKDMLPEQLKIVAKYMKGDRVLYIQADNLNKEVIYTFTPVLKGKKFKATRKTIYSPSTTFESLATNPDRIRISNLKFVKK